MASMTPQPLSMNPSSIKTRFTHGFLRALKRLSKRRQTTSSSASSSPKQIFQSYRMIKAAADVSMASAVGSRRAWSRAVLRKVRSRSQLRHDGFIRRRRRRRRVRIKKGKSRKEVGSGLTGDLQDLVPGGESMDVCSLLDETAHYIKCLTTQVQVMRNILDFCSQRQPNH